MWGQDVSFSINSPSFRIIPTRVGTSALAPSPPAAVGDHPHACGDKITQLRIPSTFAGSSPRVWGQEAICSAYRHGGIIIPTRVGTRGQIVKNASTNWDHPHACGDKRVLNVLMTIAQGSSPRVWGQVLTYTSVYVYCRIIPTRVGTSHIGNSKHIIRPDHPHACGDKTLSSKSLKDCWGSSPRVWGQDSFISIEMTSFRIIPTRVGTSLNFFQL